MLGLHNILLISQPSSSSQRTPPPAPAPAPAPPLPSSTDHHHHHHHFTAHHHADSTTFWALHHTRQHTVPNYDDNDNNDNEDSDGSLRVCRDCGNRAKKECTFKRCRTCCKTRAFDCPTHVRSTWVPASKRRDKKLHHHHHHNHPLPSSSSSSSHGLKRPRPPPPPPPPPPSTTTTSSSSANDLSLGISSHPQDSRFKKSLPGRIEAPAVFRNIKVMDLSDDGEAENAYVATVNISGHVFKGLLYDHGSEDKTNNVFPCVTKLHTDERSSKMHMETTSTSIRFRDSSSSSPIVDPSTTYTATSAAN